MRLLRCRFGQNRFVRSQVDTQDLAHRFVSAFRG
jgi:hypothetical protein